MTGPLLSLENVSVRFPIGRRRHVTAVDGVTLELREGETLGLIGESGSGKSTVARAAMGLVPIADGTVRWRGEDVAGFGAKQRRSFSESVQMVFQDPHSALDPRRTILQSVREPLDVMGRGDKKDREAVAAKALEDVGLPLQMLKRYPHQLSGGQKQRANIARALVTDPKVLVCDESVAALDVALQAEILNLLQDLKKAYELTILFISHDLSVVSYLADRISVMYLGNIVENATTESLVKQSLHPYSEALLSAQPLVHDSSAERRIVLKGDIPSPVSPPPGCRFNTRCQFAQEQCRQEKPPLLEILPNHSSACLRVDELYGERIGRTVAS
ncbi:ABC transporter ATP-binding protein [Aeromicrobium choanae]|uniref:Peptide/nickel transport system ATP-binding protein/oligopeptide transport system ATP-binding protein n=1 Tax=Aeromicrobium choanae TaxID=1736691 RepID=A0A1T4YUF1_9ACTN|nr:ABC transporter ATP-binding protein [Aeromicrobium choanae]SKB05370.1 peptide/nickel transport system ATP-binding protein/oligopeptide transport system ATP-binding protein [Aeromicrobium choanae]